MNHESTHVQHFFVVQKNTIICHEYVIHQETGFWFIFHHVPTGPSEGLYSPGHTEHVPMGLFTNNRAHSNYRVSVKMGGCVETFNQMDYYFSSFDHINKITVFVIITLINNYRNQQLDWTTATLKDKISCH